MRVAITSASLNELKTPAQDAPGLQNILLSAREHTRLLIEECFTKENAPLVACLLPVASTGFYFYSPVHSQWLANESVVSLESGDRIFVARLQNGSTLNRLEEEREGIQAAILWNDLPFGLTQCALEIDALELSKNLSLPVFWISTQWADKSETELHRRGFWVSNQNGEIARSEFQSRFSAEVFEFPLHEEMTQIPLKTAREKDSSLLSMKIIRSR